MHIHEVAGETPNTVNASVTRTRRYLTGREVEKLIEAARKHGRYGHRNATMILIAYRHGLRASELCDLQWHQVELNAGRLHVRRANRGTPSVHPMQGDEIRALRRYSASRRHRRTYSPPSAAARCRPRVSGRYLRA
jgi:integrase